MVDYFFLCLMYLRHRAYEALSRLPQQSRFLNADKIKPEKEQHSYLMNDDVTYTRDVPT